MRKRRSQSLRRAILKIHVVQKQEQVGNPLIKIWSSNNKYQATKNSCGTIRSCCVTYIMCRNFFLLFCTAGSANLSQILFPITLFQYFFYKLLTRDRPSSTTSGQCPGSRSGTGWSRRNQLSTIPAG